jgi:hypothetical protein
VFDESVRVLRPRGAMFISELHPIRQFLGGRAHFIDRATGDVVDVPVVQHSVSEFVNAGIAAGFAVDQIDEWGDVEAPAAPPRLLSIRFSKR